MTINPFENCQCSRTLLLGLFVAPIHVLGFWQHILSCVCSVCISLGFPAVPHNTHFKLLLLQLIRHTFPGTLLGIFCWLSRLLGHIQTWTLTCWTNIDQILTQNTQSVKKHVENFQGRHFIGKKPAGMPTTSQRGWGGGGYRGGEIYIYIST